MPPDNVLGEIILELGPIITSRTIELWLLATFVLLVSIKGALVFIAVAAHFALKSSPDE